jgi:DNA invertase Pin-like site-specific DNA recombinase
MSQPKRLRCAIYTRKSSEEGLEQGFNSLHAQREACEAYVQSQVGEGWAALPTIYDDGGFSGGTMDRPGLVQLLADIEKGRIDIVVVYKVDRLTRALSDFARIVEIFDKRGVSFVSVTQAFNTTSSMGRLTLNVLLSFAQFEREVTGERIRDKIAASKAKGLWMGGNVPLGYDIPIDPNNRILALNAAEADTVRLIFRRYLELGTVRRLADDLRLRGVTTKSRTTVKGRKMGGTPWLEGPLHYFLRNPVYRGNIVHKGNVHAGQHQAIVDAETFDAVQEQLRHGRAPRAIGQRGSIKSGLTGKIFDDRGHPMSPASARKDGRLHRYYVSQAVIRGDRGEPGSLARVPAEPLEVLVERELASRVDPGKVHGDAALALTRVVVSSGGVEMSFDPAMLLIATLNPEAPDAPVVLRIPVVLKTFGGAKQLIDVTGAPGQPVGPDVALQKAIARGGRWAAQLETSERAGTDDIAAVEDLQSRYVDKVLRLAWLAPDIIEEILDGKRLRDYSLTELLGADISMDWEQQRATLVLV